LHDTQFCLSCKSALDSTARAGVAYAVPAAQMTPDQLAAIAKSAFVYNRAHQRLGSYLVACDRSGVTVGLDWLDDRFGPQSGGHWPHGACAALLDHSCALSVVMGLGSTDRVAGTVDLRIDYICEGDERTTLHARAEWVSLHSPGAMACARSTVFHPGRADRPLAIATSVVALALGDAQ
jgi:acyl-coenzyme A thioesterase PaaI-like protein